MRFRHYVLLFPILYACSLSAQEFRGGELWFDHISSNKYDIFVDVYLKDATTDVKPYLLLCISCGTQFDTAFLVLNEPLSQNINLLRYKTNYVFDQEDETYPIYVVDTFYLPPLKNLEGENKGFFFLSGQLTSISILFFGLNDPPVFANYQTDYWFDEGVFYFNSKAEDPDNDTLFYFLKDYDFFPFYEYSNPDASDTITCGFTDGLLKWDKPTAPGKYLLGVDVLEYRHSGYFLSRGTRDMIIEVTEADIVSSQKEATEIEPGFSFHPNPASDHIKVLFNGAYALGSNYEMEIRDVLGRACFSRSVELLDFGAGLTVDVSGFPAGIYSVALKDGLGVTWAEKLLIE